MGAIETLPARLYCDRETFAAERTRIFARHWMLVAHAGQLAQPGDFVTADIAGKPIFVLRGRDGTLRGFHNVCRHRASPMLLAPSGQCGVLRCPYHGWMPLGDLAGTMLNLVVCHSEIHWLFHYQAGNQTFSFDDEPIKTELAGIPLTEPAVLSFIKKTLQEGVQSVRQTLTN